MVKYIRESISAYPTKLSADESFFHIHLPLAQSFIDSPRLPQSVKRLCLQTLVEGIVHLIKSRPHTQASRVVAALTQPSLWGSQIIIFLNEEYFRDFFIREDDVQQWIPLPDDSSFLRKWSIVLPPGLSIRGYKEIMSDTDFHYEGEIWFIGEL